MHKMIYATVVAAGTVSMTAMGAHAVPSAPTPASEPAAVHKTQGFGIYIGPGYDYDYGPRRRYVNPYYYGGYQPYYSRYYDGPRRYYYNSDRRSRRLFRRLQRQAP